MIPLGLELCFELRQYCPGAESTPGGKEKGQDSGSDRQVSGEAQYSCWPQGPREHYPRAHEAGQGTGDRRHIVGTHQLSYTHTQAEIPILFFHQSRAIRGKELPKMHSKIQSQGVRTLSSTSPFFKLRLATSYMGEVMAPFTGLAPVTGSESLWPTLNLQWQTPATLSPQVRCGHWPACCA